MSMFMYVRACSTLEYYDQSFDGAKVICQWLFRERVHFYKILVTAGKLAHRFLRPRREDVLSHPLSE